MTALCKLKQGEDICWLQCHSDQNRRADRQKIQINASFLPGPRKELMKRCSIYELLTFGNLFYSRRSLAVLRRQNQIADGDFTARPRRVFATAPIAPIEVCPAALICILISLLSDLVPSDVKRESIRVSPGVQRLSLTSTLIERRSPTRDDEGAS